MQKISSSPVHENEEKEVVEFDYNLEITENENPSIEFNEQKIDGEDQDIEKPHLCLTCHQSFSTFLKKHQDICVANNYFFIDSGTAGQC